MLPALVGNLLKGGLSLVANAVLAKGKSYVQEKTGVDLDKAALSEPDLITLKKFEAEHEEELLKLRLEENKLDLEELKIYLADTQGARGREVSIATSDNVPKINKIATPLIAFGTLISTFAIFILMMFGGEMMQSIDRDIVVYILGVLSANSTQVFSYYFGSSVGSAQKSQTIDNMLGGKNGSRH